MTVFLTSDQVIAEQLKQLELYGLGDPGIISSDRLESAVYAPQSGFGDTYFFNSIEEMAAAYLVRLAKAHAFGNANKRTALASSLVFLWLNGYQVDAEMQELLDAAVAAATGDGEVEPAAEFFRAHMRTSVGTKQSADFAFSQYCIHERHGSVFSVLADM